MPLENQFGIRVFKTLGTLLKTNIYAKIIEILLVFLVALLFIQWLISDEASDLIYNQFVVWLANIIMLFMVYMGLRLRGEPLTHFGFSFKKFNLKFALRTLLQSMLVFVIALLGFVLGAIVMANIVGIPESPDMGGYDYLKNNVWMLFVSLAGIYVASSFGEEVIYRAFLINRISELGLNSRSGKITAVIISALIFGLVHYSWGIVGIVQTAFMGLALGFSYLFLKKKIWVLILAHVYMDTILILQLYFS
ncbi:CPBP family intramembrane glutamic endopeptidase [Seonamhaeicola sp.]|uniref:CPBP family intramembrane glutamic endopeptidase n=1 Tax=Seonamhaeicola sp. TaxID=1912245 RepID=UPI002611C156|nr:CPBP family intramembrane glutamic endopeptidase [Seonamhaeicola sp.]